MIYFITYGYKLVFFQTKLKVIHIFQKNNIVILALDFHKCISISLTLQIDHHHYL